MTQCITCWRNSPTCPRCDTCTKGDGLNAPMRAWDGSHPPPKEQDETMKADELTIWTAQREQPWAQPYGQYKHWVTNCEGQLKHALLHAQKSLGKIATIVERLDHADSQWLSDENLDAVGDLAAELVSAALRIGNVVGRSVAHAMIRRVREKNGNGYGDELPENQRARFGAMICK